MGASEFVGEPNQPEDEGLVSLALKVTATGILQVLEVDASMFRH